MHEVVVMTVRKAVSAASMGRRGQQPLASDIIPSHDVEAGELGRSAIILWSAIPETLHDLIMGDLSWICIFIQTIGINMRYFRGMSLSVANCRFVGRKPVLCRYVTTSYMVANF